MRQDNPQMLIFDKHVSDAEDPYPFFFLNAFNAFWNEEWQLENFAFLFLMNARFLWVHMCQSCLSSVKQRRDEYSTSGSYSVGFPVGFWSSLPDYSGGEGIGHSSWASWEVFISFLSPTLTSTTQTASPFFDEDSYWLQPLPACTSPPP